MLRANTHGLDEASDTLKSTQLALPASLRTTMRVRDVFSRIREGFVNKAESRSELPGPLSELLHSETTRIGSASLRRLLYNRLLLHLDDTHHQIGYDRIAELRAPAGVRECDSSEYQDGSYLGYQVRLHLLLDHQVTDGSSMSSVSYILETLRKHHLQSSRQDSHSTRLIRLHEDRYTNGVNRFSPYILQQDILVSDGTGNSSRDGRESPELAIDRELADYDGLHVKSNAEMGRARDGGDSSFNGGLDGQIASETFGRPGKTSTATITPGDSLGTPFSTRPRDATLAISEEPSRDPNVKLNYSKTIGKPTKGLGRFMGLRVDDNQPIPSLAGSGAKRDDSRIGSPASATPTAKSGGIHSRIHSGLFRRSTASTMESFSNNSSRPSTTSAFSTSTLHQGQSNDQTPTGRTLSGLPTPSQALRQPALSRIQRPRADSAPMVVISSPGNTRVESNSTEEETPKYVKTRSPRLSDDVRTRNRSNGSDESRQRRNLAFSPSTVQAILGDDESAIASDEDHIPRPGEDPREHAKREQYGSILAQTMMTQASRRLPGLGRNLSMHRTQNARSLAEESEGSDRDDASTDGYDAGDTSTDVPESQQSNARLSNFEMGLTKANQSLLGELDIGERMSVNTTSSYGFNHKRKSRMAQVTNLQDTFQKRPIQSTGNAQPQPTGKPRPGALSLLFHPPQVNKEHSAASASAVSSPFSAYASVPPPHNSPIASLPMKIYYPFSREPFKPIEITVRKDVSVEEVIGWALFRYCEEGRKPEVYEGHDKGPNKDVNPAIWRTTAGWALRIVEDDGEVDEDFPGKGSCFAGYSHGH